MSENETVVGLSMIVRDEAGSIRACLDSILPHVDRAVIVDTGSSDATVELIRARIDLEDAISEERERFVVEETTWPDSFGVARQDALDRLLGRFPEVTHVVWLDADDVVVGGENIRSIASQIPSGVAAGVVHYAYATDPWGNLSCSHFRERIIRVDAITGWVNDVHEVLMTSPGSPMINVMAPVSSQLAGIPSNTWPIGPGGVEVVHRRPVEKDTSGRNRTILEAELASGERHARTLFYLSQEYAILGATAEDESTRDDHLRHAVDLLEEHARVGVWDEEVYQGRTRRASFLRALGRFEDALAVDLEALASRPSWPDAWTGAAMDYLELGNPDAAVAYASQALSLPYPQTVLILNPLDYSLVPRIVRARALVALGRFEDARADSTVAAGLQPQNPEVVSVHAAATENANRRSIREAVLLLDEALARHDENAKAARLLTDCVPYFLVDDAEIADRRRRRRSGVRHINTDGYYTRFYRDENPVWPITLQFPPDVAFVDANRTFCETLPRARFVTETVRARSGERELRVVDLGCNDGWLGWYLASEFGVRYEGWDLSEEALRVARSYAEHYPADVAGRVDFRYGTGPDDGEYDVAICFEVIEHLPVVSDQLRRMTELLAPDGIAFVSTPNGAYERGQIADWNSSEPRGHVRALRAADVASEILDVGGVLEGFEETPDGLVVASWSRGSANPRTVSIYLGPAGAEPWDPRDSVTRGLGGSETMAVRVATRLAERGWRVRVYANVTRKTVANVEYLPFYLWDPNDAVDVLIVSRAPGVARDEPNAARRILWLHDAEYPDLVENEDGWDAIVHVGGWQVDALWNGTAKTGTAKVVIPNAIPLDRYRDAERDFDERDPAVIYSSSPDRGLLELLDRWGEIRERVPDAKLHVAYGFTGTWRAMEPHSPGLAKLRREIEERLSLPGVIWHGTIGQEKLAELQQSSRVWAYPTDFPEVSCITAMEAQAAGLWIVATDRAELPSTLAGSAAVVLPRQAEWGDEERRRFVDEVVRGLTDRAAWTESNVANRGSATRFDTRTVVDSWERLMTEGN